MIEFRKFRLTYKEVWYDYWKYYLKFKVSNQKAKFVPREREIYHRIAPYVIVFDVSGWLESYHSGDLIMCHLEDGDHASKMADKIY